jgi:hypothetical protein
VFHLADHRGVISLVAVVTTVGGVSLGSSLSIDSYESFPPCPQRRVARVTQTCEMCSKRRTNQSWA